MRRYGALIAVMAAGFCATVRSADDWKPLFNGKDLTGWKLPDNTNPGQIAEVIAKEKDGKIVAYYGNLKKEGKEVPLWQVIMISWGLITCATMAIRGPWTFYLLRILLGVAEAGSGAVPAVLVGSLLPAPVPDRPDEGQPRAADLGQDAPEAIDDAFLVLLNHPEGACGSDQPDQGDDHDDSHYYTHRDHLSS